MPSGDRPLSVRGASGIAVASGIAAFSGLAISWVVAQSLTPAETAQFLVFWGLLFSVYGTLSGIQSETTRAVGNALHRVRSRPNSEQSERVQPADAPRMIVAGLVVGLCVAVLILLTSPAWAERLIPTGHPWTLVASAAAAVAYAGHATMAGGSAGNGDWPIYSRLMSLESIVRLAAVGIVVAFASSLVGVQYACLAAAGVWLAFLAVSRRARLAVFSRADVAMPRLLRNHAFALLTAASTAALIVGYPVLFGLTATAAEIDASAGLLLAVQLTRAPILIPLQAFQGVAIATFVAQRSGRVAALARPILIILAVTAVGSILAWLIGPTIMLVFGEEYVVAGSVLAGLTIAGGGVGVLTLTGSAVLAEERHGWYLVGWLSATTTALAMLILLPVPVEFRVTASLVVAPIVGIGLHIIGIASSQRRANRDRIEP